MKKIEFKFTKRIPDILLESFFIVVALLLALALDQWSDEQKGLELAKSAKTAIYAELANNKKKLEDKRIAHKEILKVINLYINQWDAIESSSKNLEFEYTMVLISNSAWNSAKMTEVVQSFSFKEITSFSQIYQMQALYLSNQDKIIDKVMQMGELKEEDILGFAKGLAHRLTILIDVNENFCKGLESVIAERNEG
jgi:hypothetical protein